jgi:hypothetical protein
MLQYSCQCPVTKIIGLLFIVGWCPLHHFWKLSCSLGNFSVLSLSLPQDTNSWACFFWFFLLCRCANAYENVVLNGSGCWNKIDWRLSNLAFLLFLFLPQNTSCMARSAIFSAQFSHKRSMLFSLRSYLFFWLLWNAPFIWIQLVFWSLCHYYLILYCSKWIHVFVAAWVNRLFKFSLT